MKDLFHKVKAGDRVRLTYDVEVVAADADADFLVIDSGGGNVSIRKDLPSWVAVKIIRHGPPLTVGERVRKDDHEGEIIEIRPDGDVAVVRWSDGYEGLALVDQLRRVPVKEKEAA